MLGGERRVLGFIERMVDRKVEERISHETTFLIKYLNNAIKLVETKLSLSRRADKESVAELNSVIEIQAGAQVVCKIDPHREYSFLPKKVRILVEHAQLSNVPRSYVLIGGVWIAGLSQELSEALFEAIPMEDRARHIIHSENWSQWRDVNWSVIGHSPNELQIDFKNPHDFPVNVYIAIKGDLPPDDYTAEYKVLR